MTSEKTHDLEEVTQFAQQAVQRIGGEALAFYGRGGGADDKFNQRLVTEAELHLMDMFETLLRASYPDQQLFRDNQVKNAYSHEENRYLWIFDPIDGVDNFQAGIPIWGMSLALLENFWPILGLFYLPVTNDLFHARAEGRAFWGEEKISVTRRDSIDDESLLLTFSRFHQHYQCRFPGKIRNLGCTAAHICYVAKGRADAALIANESYRDLAAARVIIEAAGGKICTLDGRQFFLNEFLNGERIKEHLLVVSPAIRQQVIAHLGRAA